MTSDSNDNNIPGFAEIVNQLQGLVYNTVLGIVQNETDAEDVTQEVFIQIHESLAGYKGEAKLSTWAYRIAINKALDFEKRKKAQRRGGLFKRVLFNAIDKLPEKQKIVFLLHKAEAMPYMEIAEVLETSVLAVESLMARAKQNLKTYLQNYYQKNNE